SFSSPPGVSRTPFRYLQTEFNEHHGQLSPDSRWIAYISDQSGRQEVYVATFPKPSERMKISVDGGIQPRWRRDGKELFYLAPDGSLMSVPVQTVPAFRAETPVPLFKTRYTYAVQDWQEWMPYYIPASGGQRFILNVTDQT